QETSSSDQLVHIAISYHADGRIVGYRNGERYGKTYNMGKPMVFSSGKTIVSFGVRHLPATGNRMFHGRIDRAKLYDRALSDDEIAASFSRSGSYVSRQQVLEALSDEQRATLAALTESESQIRTQLAEAGPVPKAASDQQAWIDLTKTMLTLKEFIYVR
ncbi:MAG: LamG domain-containing protein, partial [Fuerstiella sp.]|nr:LamG domain-containing protein [Fuerstiella sp.]